VQLSDDAKNLLVNHSWPGNVRELKNIAEQLSVLSTQPVVSAAELQKFLPENTGNRLPVLALNGTHTAEFSNEREIFIQAFFRYEKDVTELKKMFLEILQNPSLAAGMRESLVNDYNSAEQKIKNMVANAASMQPAIIQQASQPVLIHNNDAIHSHEEVEESLNIMDKEKRAYCKGFKKTPWQKKRCSHRFGH